MSESNIQSITKEEKEKLIQDAYKLGYAEGVTTKEEMIVECDNNMCAWEGLQSDCVDINGVISCPDCHCKVIKLRCKLLTRS